MIKYIIETGEKTANIIARQRRDSFFKPALKGLRCNNCNHDTVIRFQKDPEIRVVHHIEACCPDFEQKILRRLDATHD